MVFDVLLSEPGPPELDKQLAEAMATNDNLFLPLHFVFPGANGAAYDVKEPIPAFAGSATGLGHVNITFDRDGVVRRVAPCFGEKDGTSFWPHVMERVQQAITGEFSPALDRLPDCDETLLLPYVERGAFTSISYAALANGEVPEDFLNDRVVMIGATANGLGDQYPVPLGDGGIMPGVEIMANMLTAMSADNFIQPLPRWQQIAFSLVPLWIMLAGFWRWRPRTTIIVSFALVLTVLALSFVLLRFNIWFAPGAALVGLALVYPVWGWRRLQATSDFMDNELAGFRQAKVEIPIMQPDAGPVDIITGQAEELKHAISHVRDLRRFITDALRNLPDPMFITDLDGKVTFVNKLAQAGVEDGAQDLELEGMLDRFVSEEDLPDVKDYLAMEPRSTEHDYVDFTSRTGEVYAMRRAPVLSNEGELRGNIHYLADITEVAQAAEQREEVLQLLSHDMRAPQAAILALLETGHQADTDARIASHARRTLALADNFVGLARIKSEEFEGEDILLAELVTEANDSLWPLARSRGITADVDDQTGGAFVNGEPSSLYRAFVNLIDNAIKYSPDNGQIAIRLRTLEIDKQPYVAVAVKDQGEGISDEMMGQLFQRFASDDQAARSSIKGAGLGLNFVATVIERHGGTIRGENPRDGGACFTVMLPLAPDHEPVG